MCSYAVIPVNNLSCLHPAMPSHKVHHDTQASLNEADHRISVAQQTLRSSALRRLGAFASTIWPQRDMRGKLGQHSICDLSC